MTACDYGDFMCNKGSWRSLIARVLTSEPHVMSALSSCSRHTAASWRSQHAMEVACHSTHLELNHACRRNCIPGSLKVAKAIPLMILGA